MTEPTKTPKSYSTKELIKDCWFLLSGRRVLFIFYTFILIITSFIPFLIAYLVGKIIDFFTNYKVGESLNYFYIAVVIIGLSGALQVWLRFWAKWNIQTIGSEIRMKTRILAMTKLVDLELKWH